MRWFWGFLFILIGVVLFGNNLNLWHQIDIASLWIYWPFILIIIGMAIISDRWKLGSLIMILVVLMSLGFIYYTGIINEKIIVNNSETLKTGIERALPEGVTKAKIVIDASAVKVNISGRTDKLLEGNYESNLATMVTEEKVNGDTIEYNIKTEKKNQNWNSRKFVNALNLKLSDSIPIEVVLEAKASSVDMDIREQKINLVSIANSASSVKLTLGDKVENETKIIIDSSASKVNINIPKEIGANINIDSSASSNNFNRLIEKNKHEYNTENFATAAKKINFNIDASASSINFNNN